MGSFNQGVGPGGCPCRECGDRVIKCHGSCEAYKEWKKKADAFREAERKDRMFYVNDDRLRELDRRRKCLRAWGGRNHANND